MELLMLLIPVCDYSPAPMPLSPAHSTFTESGDDLPDNLGNKIQLNSGMAITDSLPDGENEVAQAATKLQPYIPQRI
jgi:hypothetical protein